MNQILQEDKLKNSMVKDEGARKSQPLGPRTIMQTSLARERPK